MGTFLRFDAVSESKFSAIRLTCKPFPIPEVAHLPASETAMSPRSSFGSSEANSPRMVHNLGSPRMKLNLQNLTQEFTFAAASFAEADPDVQPARRSEDRGDIGISGSGLWRLSLLEIEFPVKSDQVSCHRSAALYTATV